MTQILLTNEFEINNVSFTQPRKNTMGGQNILVNYSSGPDQRPGPLVFQTPRLRAPFGVDRQENEGAGPVKFNVNVSLAHGDSPNEQVQAFTDNIRALDDFVKEKGVELSSSWFGKAKSADVIDELYKPCEKHAKDPKWASTLKLKLPLREGKPMFDVYDDSKNKLNIVGEDGELSPDFLPKGCQIVALIQCTGIWFMGKTQFGIGWKVLQMKVYQTGGLVGYSIIDDDEAKEEDESEGEEN